MPSDALQGRRILVVEDEYMMAELLTFHLRHVGAHVIGPAANVAQALQQVRDELSIDAAVVDVNLGGEMAFPVADALLARNVPFVFTTGYEERIIRSRYPTIKYCEKPVEFHTLLDALIGVLADGSSRS